MNDRKFLGEMSTVAQLAAAAITILLLLHLVSGGRWRKAHTALGAAGAGLFLLSLA